MPNKIRFRKLLKKDLKSVFEIYSDKKAMKFRRSQPIETADKLIKEFLDAMNEAFVMMKRLSATKNQN